MFQPSGPDHMLNKTGKVLNDFHPLPSPVIYILHYASLYGVCKIKLGSKYDVWVFGDFCILKRAQNGFWNSFEV